MNQFNMVNAVNDLGRNLLIVNRTRKQEQQKLENAYRYPTEPGRCPQCNSRQYYGETDHGYCLNCGYKEKPTQYKDQI